MVKLRKNKTFRKKRLDKNKNKKNNTKKRLKGGSRETTLRKLKEIERMTSKPKIKIEINKKDDPKNNFLMLDRLDHQNVLGKHIPNIIEKSNYTFDYSVKNAVKIIFPRYISHRLTEYYTYTIIFDENNKTIISIIIEFDSNNIKYIKEFSADEYEIKIDYLQDKETTEEIVEKLSKQNFLSEDLQRGISGFLSDNDRVNII
jgi:hypothetical protein